jgi:site-specific recombinase XerD
MAILRPKGDSCFVRFWLAGRQFERGVGRDPGRAEATLKRVEATLLDIKNGRLKVPEGADIAQFVVSDGESTEKPKLPEVVTLADLFRRYEELLPVGAMEPNSLTTHRIHRNHLTRLLGAKAVMQQIDHDLLQRYINKRSGEGVQRDTIQKEVATYGSIWKWAARRKLVTGLSPTEDLIYPKANDKPPFMTWAEIETTIACGGMAPEQSVHLWDCLFLDRDQIAEVLAYVKASAQQPFIHPMFAFIALTGCRRSEMLRSERRDLNLVTGKVAIREKKRDRRVKCTYRYVNMHPFLAQVMQDWFAVYPGGLYTFCEQPNVPLTVKAAWYHFKETLAGSKWSVLRGFHVFRHSFVSNLACANTDQRVIDEFVGHQTDALRKRYRHLFPKTKQDAIEAALGQPSSLPPSLRR